MTTKSGSQLLYGDLSYLIRGACFEIYKKFGGDFKEVVINRALVLELEHGGLKVDTQKRISINYRGKKIGTYIPDLIIEDKILIELKAKVFLTKEDERQFWRYLKGSDYRLGFLINFGPTKLDTKRRIYDKARQHPR